MDRRTFVTSSAAAAVAAAGYGMLGERRLALTDAGAPGPVPPKTVRVSSFGADGPALQRAIDTRAREVVVDSRIVVASDVRLRSDQVLRFRGGAVHVVADAKIGKAVLYGEGTRNLAIIDPVVVGSSGREGVPGIRLLDAVGIRVSGGRLTRVNLMVESYDSAVPRAIAVDGLTIDMGGWQSTAVYVSGVRDVTVRDVECFDGLEGVGIYNGARAIRLVDVSSHSHRQDGFVIIAGQDISHVGCKAYANGQSGFTTHRQSSGEDTRFISWERCLAERNAFDGFDIRGADKRPWRVDTGYALSICTANDNRRCGFYVVMAEGTVLKDCAAALNDEQNLFIDNSDDVVASGFRSTSGAKIVPSGPNKAGILVYNSQAARLEAPVSRNGAAGTQDFGVSFTGNSGGGRLRGGDLSDNRTRSVFAAAEALVDD